MITREDIRELAQFQSADREGCALSFYFQPQTPQNKSHREEAILAKDLVRNALREAEKQGKNGATRADLNRILEIAGRLHGNQARAKAIFACGAKNFWREFDLPPLLAGTQMRTNRRFYLRPLAAILGAHPRLCVTILDRQRARLFDMRLDELREREGLFHELARRGRGDGFRGYDAGHSDRRVADDAMHHFKAVAEHLKDELDKGTFEKLIVGCQEPHWAEFEPHLHPYLKQRLIGHFPAEITAITNEQIRDRANRVLSEAQDKRRQALVREIIGQSQRNGFGATGLRRVLQSLEMGEVQTLLIGESFRGRGIECAACGHLDSRLTSSCPVCGRETRELEDISEAVLPRVIVSDIELFYVKEDPELDRVGNIGALLRFRADQNTPSKLAS